MIHHRIEVRPFQRLETERGFRGVERAGFGAERDGVEEELRPSSEAPNPGRLTPIRGKVAFNL
jgi:hypothetical protein